MLENKQTPKLENFTIVQDGEVTTDYDPSTLTVARESVISGISRAVEHIKLETRMLVFDALHKTNYRQIRHDLVAAEKRTKFEASIGLVAVGKKKH